MRFVVKQAAEAPAEKPVELSIEENEVGWACVKANGSAILAFLPDGTAIPYPLTSADRALGFVADMDGRLKILRRPSL